MPTVFKIRQFEEGAFYANVVSIDNTDSPYTVLASTNTILVDTTSGTVTINLPAVSASNAGRRIAFRDAGGSAGTNSITLDANGSDTIDGSGTLAMSTDRQTVTLESDGVSEWAIIERN